MPTRAGWSLAVLAALTVAGGRLLGLREVYLVGVGEAALLLFGLAFVWARPVAVEATRRLSAGRVAGGGTCRVEVVITATGRRPAPPLDLVDGAAPCPVRQAVRPGAPARATYRFGASRRGLVAVGPLVARLTDPFGLVARHVTLLAPDRLLVHPTIDPVGDPPQPAAVGAATVSVAAPPGGDGEFHSLRAYQDGDDLRAVHWRTSARLGALFVRLPEARTVTTTVVALDLRRAVHSPASIERAVSAAAGVAAACAGAGRVRLVTTGGADSGVSGGAAHLDVVLDLLAMAGADDGSPDGLAAAVGRSDPAAVVLVTTGAASPADLRAFGAVRVAHPLLVAVRVPFGDRPALPLAPEPPFDRVVTVAPGARLLPAWEQAMAVGR